MNDPNPGLFSVPAGGDTTVSGLEGGSVHARETPFGCGSIADQEVSNGGGRHIATFNRFNQEVGSLLADIPAFDPLR
jgi:hypothetical protein